MRKYLFVDSQYILQMEDVGKYHILVHEPSMIFNTIFSLCLDRGGDVRSSDWMVNTGTLQRHTFVTLAP